MIILIAGGTHTGKTVLAQRLLEKHHYPYLSIDHLKMGLIRSGHCPLTPESNEHEITDFLWPVIREIIKTCIENGQNLIVEGCYIPFAYASDFTAPYLKVMRYVCLVFSQDYICSHFETIRRFANVVEHRIGSTAMTQDSLVAENRNNLRSCQEYGLDYILIDDEYTVNFDITN